MPDRTPQIGLPFQCLRAPHLTNTPSPHTHTDLCPGCRVARGWTRGGLFHRNRKELWRWATQKEESESAEGTIKFSHPPFVSRSPAHTGVPAAILHSSPDRQRTWVSPGGARALVKCPNSLPMAIQRFSLPTQKAFSAKGSPSSKRNRRMMVTSRDFSFPAFPVNGLYFQIWDYLICSCMLSRSNQGSLWPYGLQKTRVLCGWDSPGKNTGVGGHALLQGISPTQGSNLRLFTASCIDRGFSATSATWDVWQHRLELTGP